MRRYENVGTVIEVPIKNEYWIVATINPVDKDKKDFKCDLQITDKEAGLTIDLEKSATLPSDAKMIKANVTTYLSQLIDNGYFENDIRRITNIYNCVLAQVVANEEV